MSNAIRHLYKYAKGHYGHGASVEKDLQVILGQYCAISASCITPNDIIYWLCKYAKKHLDETWRFEELIIRIFRTEGHLENLFNVLLVPLSMCKVSVLSFELGENDTDLMIALGNARTPS